MAKLRGPSNNPIQPNPIALKAVRNARLALGTPYVWGGTQYDKGVDCSGLIYVAYRMAGHPVPRTTYEQVKLGTPVGRGQEIPGDLVFSYPEVAGPGHVVMAIGNGKCIAAPHTGAVVMIEDLAVFKSVYVTTRRVVPPVGYGTAPGGGSSSGSDSSSGGGFASGITGAFSVLTDPHTWYRVGQVLVGMILLVFAMYVFIKRT